MSKTRTIVCTAIVFLFFAAIVALLWLNPRVTVTVNRRLVGPDDEAMDLLAQDAPLGQIQLAVRRSRKHVDQMSYLGGTLLYCAVEERRIDVASWLLTEGADPNGTYHGVGGVPLEKAIRQGDTAMVRLLIDAGADPDLEMPYGVTPRLRAKKIGNTEILAILPPKRKSANGAASRSASRPHLGSKMVRRR